MMVNAQELVPGRTYFIQTNCKTFDQMCEYCKELDRVVPHGTHLIILSEHEKLKIEFN